jgi:hypothetical protein
MLNLLLMFQGVVYDKVKVGGGGQDDAKFLILSSHVAMGSFATCRTASHPLDALPSFFFS